MKEHAGISILFVIIGAAVLLSIGCSSLPSSTSDNSEEARQYFEESLAMSKEWDFQGALEAIERAIELEPSNPNYVMFRGTYQRLLGDRLAPLRALDKALEMDPGNPRFYNNRGAILMGLGLYEEAKKDIEQTFKLGNERLRWASMDTLSWIQYLTGEYEKALDTLHQIEIEFPENFTITSLLRYRILYDTDGPEVAVKYGRQVLAEGNLPLLEENGMRLLLGMVDLRDVEIKHVFVLGYYMLLLRDFEFQNPAAEKIETRLSTSSEESPVLLIREVKIMHTEDALGMIMANIIRSSLVKYTVFRLVDDESRAAAAEEIKIQLSGLTENETDIELGRFLAADFILAASLTQVQGEYFCNIIISDSVHAEILLSEFFFCESMEGIGEKVAVFTQGITDR